MSVRGMAQAQKYHEEHTGLPYTPLKLSSERGKNIATVRVLRNPHEIESLFIHQKFNVLKPMRCTADTFEAPEDCPLCMVDAPRSLRTYLPVRVRGDENEKRVQIMELGREKLADLEAIVEELPIAYVAMPDPEHEGQTVQVEINDLTGCDIKIKRTGEKLQTKYHFIAVSGTERPLTEEERALEVPEMDDIVNRRSPAEMERGAQAWKAYLMAKDSSTEGSSGDDDEDTPRRREMPF